MVLIGGNLETSGVGAITALISMSLPIAIALFLPNTQQLMRRERPVLEAVTPAAIPLTWRNNAAWASIVGSLAAYASFGGAGVSQFLYFNF